jgi:hypothetical protein
MLAALDLTARQAGRVVAQAVRIKARVELEPRPDTCDELLVGHITGVDGNLLRVGLAPGQHRFPLAGLIGAFCDVRLVLSGQMYMFSTCIIEATENSAQLHLVTAMPESVQVANRRRGIRKQLGGTVQVQLWAEGVSEPFICEITDIAADGLGCSGTKRELDEVLLVGDEVHIRFELRDAGPFALNAILCNKSCSSAAADQVLVGMEFKVSEENEEARATLERLRNALFEDAFEAEKETDL